MTQETDIFLPTYKRLPIAIERAAGNKIWDKNGICYYDFLAGIAVNILGHSHPKIIEAVHNQISRYMHVSNYFYQDTQICLASKLAKMSNMNKVFLANSGTEANEGVIKLCRRWGYDQNKIEIIAFTGAFHGRTCGSLSLMDKPSYKDKMGPWLGNIRIIPYNDCTALANAVTENTAGVIFECIQGEGGLAGISHEMVAAINDLQQKFGFLSIADEVQTGAGRTGSFLACHTLGISPDIVTVAKGIGGGLPLGAILVKEPLATIWQQGSHGSTFGGNAVACAAGLAVLQELEAGVMDNAKDAGKYFKGQLDNTRRAFPDKIIEVRGMGLMLGIVLTFEAAILVEELLKERIIANATSTNVLRLVPPLNITYSDIDVFIAKLRICLERI